MVIVFFAAVALGRCAVVGVKDAALAERAAAIAPPGPDLAAAQAPGGRDTGEHDESPTVTGRFPAAERDAFTPAERTQDRPEASAVPPGASSVPASSVPASSVPASSPGDTTAQA